MFLTQQLPISTGAMSAFPYSPELEAAFLFKPKFGEVVNVSVKDGGTLFVPRNLAPLGKTDYRTSNQLGAINCAKPPRDDEQAKLIAKSIALLEHGYSHVFEAPTGFGKTYCGVAVAGAVGEATLILVTKEDLVHSWRDTLIHLMGIPAHEIGHIQQNKCDYVGKRFVIAMVHSIIIPDKYPPEMYKYFGLVIFDEVHRMAADSFVQACQMLYAKLRLGFSATTKRGDGKWEIIEGHIGEVMVRGTSIPMHAKILVRRTGWKPPKMPLQPGKLMHVYKLMAKDKERNMHAVEFTVSAFKAGRNILLLSDLLDDHLKPLFHLLAQNGIPGDLMDFYVGGRTKAELEAAKKARVCLGTYKMCSEGTDNPAWDTLVFLTPHAEIEQSLGRILRKKEGKKEPVALDLVDNHSILQGYYLKREHQYFKGKHKVVKMD
jgi:superfamily II DNA or RNA helicase